MENGLAPNQAPSEEVLNPRSAVAVLDFGGQYVDLVAKAVERHGVTVRILPHDTPREFLEAHFGAVIMSGSPASSQTEHAPMPDPNLWDSNLPILGICYGMQAMAQAHGGQVSKGSIREDGRVTTSVDTSHPIFSGSKQAFAGLFTHGDFVRAVPRGFTAIGQHELGDGAIAYSAIANGNKVGVQFHPEVFDDTPGGYELFGNFLFGIAELEANETFQQERLEQTIADKRQQIAEQVGDRHVIAFVSGGVDSTVAATLAASVVAPEKFHAFYIDNGFMRQEDEDVIDSLIAAGINVVKVDAAEYFKRATTIVDGKKTKPLVNVTDPETKRKIIGKTFIDIQNRLLAGLGLSEALLLQGTNAADRIESGHSDVGTGTDTIKTHHNQVAEVQELKARGLLVEPLSDLFKDEIRAIGYALGLPAELVERHPFPGPGDAIRILCHSGRSHLGRIAASIKDAPLNKKIKSYVGSHQHGTSVEAQLLPVKSVGVGGDERSYAKVVALSGQDVSPEAMEALAHDIPAYFRGKVNRVLLALGPQPIERRREIKTSLGEEEKKIKWLVDQIGFQAMRSFGVLDKIKQMPLVLLPLAIDKSGERPVVLRPVTTSTFMTVQAMLPERDLPREFFSYITDRILREVPGISQVFLDLTNKPPGTTEWE